jgi:long-chain acyl-CoA synthetase
MISHENLLAATKGNLYRLSGANIVKPLTNRHCSFLPMAHIFERFVILQILLRGTEVVFCPAPEKLIDYLSKVKPTQASVVPRILNKVYDTVMTEVNKSKVKQFLVQQALREQPSFLSRYVFRKVKNLFGGELKAMITGSAPVKPDVMHFFRIALDIPIIEGYGQTESAAAGATTHPMDTSYGTVGSPGPNVEIKLIDVPDTKYRSAMNQGEVCIRGPTVFKGKEDLLIDIASISLLSKAIMVMKPRHGKQLMKMAGCIQVMLANGQVLVHCALLIAQNIYLN